MYNSKYYSCEEIDQRLLQGYYDDAVAKGFPGTITDFHEVIKTAYYHAKASSLSEVIYEVLGELPLMGISMGDSKVSAKLAKGRKVVLTANTESTGAVAYGIKLPDNLLVNGQTYTIKGTVSNNTHGNISIGNYPALSGNTQQNFWLVYDQPQGTANINYTFVYRNNFPYLALPKSALRYIGDSVTLDLYIDNPNGKIPVIEQAIQELQQGGQLINITTNSHGDHIWNVNGAQYILTPYTEPATVVSSSYGVIEITEFAYSGAVSNEGVAATVSTLNFRQNLHKVWSDGRETDEWVNGTKSSSGATFTYTGSNLLNNASVAADGRVSASAATIGSSQRIAVVTPQVTWHNVTSENTTVKANVNQNAATCTFSNGSRTYSKNNVSFEGTEFTVTINKSSGVSITGVSGSTGTTPTLEGSGNTTVRVVVGQNPNESPRSLTVTVTSTIGNLTINISQVALTVPKYIYIGQINQTNSGFAGLSSAELIAASTKTAVNSGTSASGTVAGVSVAGCYEHQTACNKNIYFIMVPDTANVKAARLAAAIPSEWAWSDITDSNQWKAVHSAITIDGVSYSIYGYRESALPGNNIYLYVQ